mmetsp:Transcript_47056/g.145396  ORF Transcript_47056/g.145396 Transcript_47056/m.145396 type:complete len:209 (+) Transcript_47056:10-636(+)
MKHHVTVLSIELAPSSQVPAYSCISRFGPFRCELDAGCSSTSSACLETSPPDTHCSLLSSRLRNFSLRKGLPDTNAGRFGPSCMNFSGSFSTSFSTVWVNFRYLSRLSLPGRGRCLRLTLVCLSAWQNWQASPSLQPVAETKLGQRPLFSGSPHMHGRPLLACAAIVACAANVFPAEGCRIRLCPASACPAKASPVLWLWLFSLEDVS